MHAISPGPSLNLLAAWAGILLGFISGMILGLFFHRENWLGGYGSLKRRLYRLAHISFFGLAGINALFGFTALLLTPDTLRVCCASWLFVAGAATMPVCCIVMAHWPKGQALFAIPVLSLLAGGALTILELVNV